MNSDTVDGTIKDIGGKAKETFGQATGDQGAQAEGLADQLCGKAQRMFGEAFGDHFHNATEGVEPFVEKAKAFVKENPVATAIVGAIVGAAILGSLRSGSDS